MICSCSCLPCPCTCIPCPCTCISCPCAGPPCHHPPRRCPPNCPSHCPRNCPSHGPRYYPPNRPRYCCTCRLAPCRVSLRGGEGPDACKALKGGERRRCYG